MSFNEFKRPDGRRVLVDTKRTIAIWEDYTIKKSGPNDPFTAIWIEVGQGYEIIRTSEDYTKVIERIFLNDEVGREIRRP